MVFNIIYLYYYYVIYLICTFNINAILQGALFSNMAIQFTRHQFILLSLFVLLSQSAEAQAFKNTLTIA